MIQFFQETVNYVNFPITALLIGMLLYWLMVIVGVVGMDGIDFGLDLDADVDVGLDVDVDVGLDVDAGIDADVDFDGGSLDGAPQAQLGGGSSTTGSDSALRTLFEYFYLGEIPIVIVASFLVLYLWMATILTNHYTNPNQSFLIAAAWFLPNILISLVLLRYSMMPVAILFRKPPPENKTRDELLGLTGRVTTSEVTETFGQIEIKQGDEPEIILNVRTRPGKSLAKNDLARVMSYNNDDGTFIVEYTQLESGIND